MGGNDSCNCALAEARKAHQQVLEDAHILEEKIEQLSWLATRMRSTSCHLSHGHLRRQSRGHPRGHIKTAAGGDDAKAPLAISHQGDQRGRCLQSPSPTQLRRWVTFQNQKGESLPEDSLGEHRGQVSGRGEPAECNLGPPPTLEPELESFLGGQHPHKMQKGLVTCHQSPPWKIMRCGWSGEPTVLICWSGGRN